MRFLSLSSMVLMFICSGCASIVSMNEYAVSVTSCPPDALVIVRNRNGNELLRTKTPATVVLSSRSGYLIPARYSFEFRKEGYSPCFENLVGDVNLWYLGNAVLPGGIIGLLVVDPMTGAMWKLGRNISVNMTAGGKGK